MQTQLTGPHRTTYDSVFQHPVARNLAWRDVLSMLDALPGVIQKEHEGALKITRNGRTVVLHHPVRKNVTDVQEVMDLRRFLEHSETTSHPAEASGVHVLVVIDHRQARIYKTELH